MSKQTCWRCKKIFERSFVSYAPCSKCTKEIYNLINDIPNNPCKKVLDNKGHETEAFYPPYSFDDFH